MPSAVAGRTVESSLAFASAALAAAVAERASVAPLAGSADLLLGAQVISEYEQLDRNPGKKLA